MENGAAVRPGRQESIMTDVLSQPAIDALARTLGHFIWQGAVIALLSLGAFRMFRGSAAARYIVGVAGMAAMLAAPVATFFVINGAGVMAPSSLASAPTLSLDLALATVSVSTAANAATTELNWMAIAVLAWMVGVAGFMMRLVGGWII